jgi:hypothetical protein
VTKSANEPLVYSMMAVPELAAAASWARISPQLSQKREPAALVCPCPQRGPAP